MRITNHLITNRFLQDLSRNLERLAEVQLQLSTARRLNEASDDPVGASRAISLRSTLTALEQFQRNGVKAEALLGATSSTLDRIRETLVRAKELALRGANGFLQASDRLALADQVNQSLEDLLALSQTRFADRYLFGGIQTTSPPFTPTRDARGRIVGVSANPQGIDGTVAFEVSEGVTLMVNAPGDGVFQQPVNLFQVLIGLRDSLEADNLQGIVAALDDLEAGLTQALAAHGDVGARLSRMEGIKAGLDQDLLRVKTLLAETEEADLAQLFVEFQEREQVYQASLAAGARLIPPGLLDFLR